MVSVFWKFPAPQPSKLNHPSLIFSRSRKCLHFSVTSNPLLPSKKPVKGYPPAPKPSISGLQRRVSTSDPKLQVTHSKDLFKVVQESFILCIYGEEAGEKIPIKSLPQEFQKSGLNRSISSVYIFVM